MKIGSQMDVYVKVEEIFFDTQTVAANFNLLLQPDAVYPPCHDSVLANAKYAPSGYTLDGGVPRYYVPVVLRCGSCDNAHSGTKRNHCSRCKKVNYCSRECQVKDWKQCHKKEYHLLDGCGI